MYCQKRDLFPKLFLSRRFGDPDRRLGDWERIGIFEKGWVTRMERINYYSWNWGNPNEVLLK